MWFLPIQERDREIERDRIQLILLTPRTPHSLASINPWLRTSNDVYLNSLGLLLYEGTCVYVYLGIGETTIRFVKYGPRCQERQNTDIIPSLKLRSILSPSENILARISRMCDTDCIQEYTRPITARH